jgi:hypothetical protein
VLFSRDAHSALSTPICFFYLSFLVVSLAVVLLVRQGLSRYLWGCSTRLGLSQMWWLSVRRMCWRVSGLVLFLLLCLKMTGRLYSVLWLCLFVCLCLCVFVYVTGVVVLCSGNVRGKSEAIAEGAIEPLVGILQQDVMTKTAFACSSGVVVTNCSDWCLYLCLPVCVRRIALMEALMAITTNLDGQRKAIECGLCEVVQGTLQSENPHLILPSIKACLAVAGCVMLISFFGVYVLLSVWCGLVGGVGVFVFCVCVSVPACAAVVSVGLGTFVVLCRWWRTWRSTREDGKSCRCAWSRCGS